MVCVPPSSVEEEPLSDMNQSALNVSRDLLASDASLATVVAIASSASNSCEVEARCSHLMSNDQPFRTSALLQSSAAIKLANDVCDATKRSLSTLPKDRLCHTGPGTSIFFLPPSTGFSRSCTNEVSYLDRAAAFQRTVYICLDSSPC